MAGQRVSAQERGAQKPANPLFQNTARKAQLVGRTYKISDDIAKALDLYAAYDGRDKSEIVRDALLAAIPEKYIDEARNLLAGQV